MQLLHTLLLLADITTAALFTGPARHEIEDPSQTGYSGSGFPAGVRISGIAYSCAYGVAAEFNFADGNDQTPVQDLKLPSFTAVSGDLNKPLRSESFCNTIVQIRTNGWQFRMGSKNGTVKVKISASIPAGVEVQYTVRYSIGGFERSEAEIVYVIPPGEGHLEFFEGTIDNKPDPNFTTKWSSCAGNETMMVIYRIIRHSGANIPGKSEVEAGTSLFNVSAFEWRKCP